MDGTMWLHHPRRALITAAGDAVGHESRLHRGRRRGEERSAAHGRHDVAAPPTDGQDERAQNALAFVLENFNVCVDEALIIKRKSEEVLSYLSGRCIYLVGMMGSGKTTVGKILAQVLGYSFVDSDKLVEQSVGVSSVAQIFKESEVLRDLSTMHGLVVATGGGAVIRAINWKYMRHGITVWLDVPLETLATRIAAVGTGSRPLLHQGSGDPYTKAFTALATLAEKRGDAYANADPRVCLQYVAAKQGHGDVSLLTPTAIAIEALIKIKSLTEFATTGGL